ncbi:MAG: hypothetical protein HY296_02105 [Thaumarchaeota archaeon]|nr:hypothetical protein [Nitrososphaerota archaeon]
MGWLLKLGAVLLLVMSMTLGSWLIAFGCVLYLYFSLRKKPADHSPLLSRKVSSFQGLPARELGGAILVMASLVALGLGGRASSLVLFVLGAGLLAAPRLPLFRRVAEVVHVKDTILFRWRYIPMRWSAVVEFKVAGRTFRGLPALPGVHVIDARGPPRVYSVLTVFALGAREAEDGVLRRVSKIASSAAELGAYALPLDGDGAKDVLRLHHDTEPIASQDVTGLGFPSRGTTVLKAVGDFVERVSFYSGPDEGNTLLVPTASKRLRTRPLTLEVLRHLMGDAAAIPPDAIAVFLNSMHVTRGESVGEKLLLEPVKDGSVEVQAPGSEKVTLSRAQVRALVRMYP